MLLDVGDIWPSIWASYLWVLNNNDDDDISLSLLFVIHLIALLSDGWGIVFKFLIPQISLHKKTYWNGKQYGGSSKN